MPIYKSSGKLDRIRQALGDLNFSHKKADPEWVDRLHSQYKSKGYQILDESMKDSPGVMAHNTKVYTNGKHTVALDSPEADMIRSGKLTGYNQDTVTTHMRKWDPSNAVYDNLPKEELDDLKGAYYSSKVKPTSDPIEEMAYLKEHPEGIKFYADDTTSKVVKDTFKTPNAKDLGAKVEIPGTVPKSVEPKGSIQDTDINGDDGGLLNNLHNMLPSMEQISDNANIIGGGIAGLGSLYVANKLRKNMLTKGASILGGTALGIAGIGALATLGNKAIKGFEGLKKSIATHAPIKAVREAFKPNYHPIVEAKLKALDAAKLDHNKRMHYLAGAKTFLDGRFSEAKNVIDTKTIDTAKHNAARYANNESFLSGIAGAKDIIRNAGNDVSLAKARLNSGISEELARSKGLFDALSNDRFPKLASYKEGSAVDIFEDEDRKGRSFNELEDATNVGIYGTKTPKNKPRPKNSITLNTSGKKGKGKNKGSKH